MARASFGQKRPFIVLAAIVAAWLFLPLAVARMLKASFFEFQAPATKAASYVRDLQAYWSQRTRSREELVGAGMELTHAINALSLSVQRMESLRAENHRLEELLQLPSLAGYRYEVARIERRDLSAWWQQMVIRKGANYDLRPGLPVVFSGGVVGRVREVHAFSSVVELCGSPGFRLAAVVEGDDRPLSYTGGVNRPLAPASGRAEFVPADIEATPLTPKRLYTSGLGGVFPPGLFVGTVEELRRTADGLFKEGVVLLDPRLSALSEVAVLVPDAAAPAQD